MKDYITSSKSTEWETPQPLFDALDREFTFTLDVAATRKNTKVKSRYFTKKDDGLSRNWDHEIVWMNPPYGRNITDKWVEKASEARGGVVVCLLPARTDTRFFHDFIYQKLNVEIRFLKGRIKFVTAENGAPFPSMIVIFKP